MDSPTQPLREEHRELLPHIEQLRLAADLVGEGRRSSRPGAPPTRLTDSWSVT